MRLEASGLVHSFGDRLILDGVDLEVDRGASVAIIGPSGTGKTTLLSLLGGLLEPDEGDVAVVGADGARHRPGSFVAWVLQTVNVLPDRTALDNVALGALSQRSGFESAQRLAATALARVGLAAMLDTPAKRLSGGEVQRVVMARALASDAPYILADEPTGQLDRGTTRSVMGALTSSLGFRGLVVVTHDLEVARSCDRAFRLSDGTLVEA